MPPPGIEPATFRLVALRHRVPPIKGVITVNTNLFVVFDIYISVHRNKILNYSQQDAIFLNFLFF